MVTTPLFDRGGDRQWRGWGCGVGGFDQRLNRRFLCAESNTNDALSHRKQQVQPESCGSASDLWLHKMSKSDATDFSSISRYHILSFQSALISQ